MTGEIINLRQRRKQRARDERADEAAANRLQFGRTKDEKERARREAERAARNHDGHHIAERDDAPPPGPKDK
jgi:hypothetical protein